MGKYNIGQHGACYEAREWYASQPDTRTAWETCLRGDWMLWIAAAVRVDNRKLTLAKGLCANTVRDLMKDPRSVAALDAAIAYGRGEIDKIPVYTVDAARDAYGAAYSVYAVAAAVYSAVAANSPTVAVAVAGAAYSVVATITAADAPAVAAAVAAANAATNAADRRRNEQQTADICREILTSEVCDLF